MAKWNRLKGRLKKNLKANFREYCEKTTIHGIRYVAEGNIFKRIVWLFICCFLIVISGKQIYEIVLKWKHNSLVVSHDKQFSSIEDIDFPAVTICYQTLPQNTEFNFTELYETVIKNETFEFSNEKELIFDIQYYDEYCDSEPKIYIHNPNDIPWDDAIEFKMGEFQQTKLSISPVVYKTDDSLKYDYTPEDRGCYFPDEHYLRFFQVYSQKNCELECWTNATIENLNCTTYWMPYTDGIRPCEMVNYFSNDLLNRLKKNFYCNCLPNCNSTKYDVKKMGSNIIRDNIKFYNSMNIEIFFQDSMFMAMRRHLSYSFADFLSQIGGILGCFLGISIFSLIELVYFCTVQMFRQPKAPKSHEK
ncbi:pickpocket protein 11-like [Culicoides brevitarsis]|uniref:pickpocket protein 11-like n=1 Tax=Culicoides brevitarsis TaxID=469753 RepID=UPI00307BE4B1